MVVLRWVLIVDAIGYSFRCGVLTLFVARELFEPEVAEGMLEWFQSGFSVHDGV